MARGTALLRLPRRAPRHQHQRVPYHRRKLEERLGVLRDRAREFGGWIAYVNAVGGQDELVFDGGSVVVGPDGEVACRAAQFEEDLLRRRRRRRAGPRRPRRHVAGATSLDLPGARPRSPRLRRKNGFDGVVPGPSGIDSRLVAVLAADAWARSRSAPRDALAVLEPREPGGRDRGRVPWDRPRRRVDRRRLRRLPIDAPPLFEGRAEDVTEENLQADPRQPPDGRLQSPAGSSSRPATRASTPSATPRSTATWPVGSRRSRTCPRPSCTSSAAGGTTRVRCTDPGARDDAAVRRAAAGSEGHRLAAPTTSSTRSSRPTSRTTSASTRSSSEDTIA